MNFLHTRENLNSGDVVVVDCSHQCNIMLLTDHNFNHYKKGNKFQYHGGAYKMFPVRISVPSNDNWNIVLDLGGGNATVEHSISFIKNS